MKYYNNYLVKRWYVDQFSDFQQTTDIKELEIVHADVEQLRRILIECERPYNKIEKDMGYQLGSQERWMQMKGLVPIGSDAEIPDDMDP